MYCTYAIFLIWIEFMVRLPQHSGESSHTCHVCQVVICYILLPCSVAVRLPFGFYRTKKCIYLFTLFCGFHWTYTAPVWIIDWLICRRNVLKPIQNRLGTRLSIKLCGTQTWHLFIVNWTKDCGLFGPKPYKLNASFYWTRKWRFFFSIYFTFVFTVQIMW